MTNVDPRFHIHINAPNYRASSQAGGAPSLQTGTAPAGEHYRLEGRPGQVVDLQVSIQNRTHQGATIVAFLTSNDPEITRWCDRPQHKLNLSPGQTQILNFRFTIPDRAWDDQYRFTLTLVDLQSVPEFQFNQTLDFRIFADNPLDIILDPSDSLEVGAGGTAELRVTILNQGSKGANIDVFIAEADRILSQWCQKRSHKFGLASGRSDQTLFRFEVPVDALAGTYSYTLEVDAPNDYPDDTPIQTHLKLKVRDKRATVVRMNDPTFTIDPPSSPSKPATLRPGTPLIFTFQVDNKSPQVDRFRLSSDELEPGWYTIRYPSNTIGVSGLAATTNFLELNPGTQGVIQVELHPPLEVLAGAYHPSFRLHSSNNSELVLLDLVYFQIEPLRRLSVVLDADQDQVSKGPGRYFLRLTNQGNTVRQLMFSARTRNVDDKELCEYDLKPPEVRLVPGKSVQSLVEVQPIHRCKRPFWGKGLAIAFEVRLRDTDDQPLTRQEELQEGSLIWKRRPWWHLALLILGILAGIGTLWWLIWFLFFRPPAVPKIENFATHKQSYTEGEKILLNLNLTWRGHEIEKMEKIEIVGTVEPIEGTSQPPRPPEPIVIYQRAGESSLPEGCEFFSPQELNCTSLPTSATAAGQYHFTIQVSYNRKKDPIDQETDVTIALKASPEIATFNADPPEFTEGENTWLSWTIGSLDSTDQITQLQVIAISENGVSKTIPLYQKDAETPSILDLKDCTQEFRVLTCTEIPLEKLEAGLYNLTLSGKTTDNQNRPVELAGKNTTIKIEEPPIKILAFTVNGIAVDPPADPNNPQTSTCVKSGESATVTWNVRGKDVEVQVGDLRNYPPQGNVTYPLPKPNLLREEYPLQLTAKNKEGFTVESNIMRVFIDPNDCKNPSETGPISVPPISTPSGSSVSSDAQSDNLMIMADTLLAKLDQESKQIQRQIQQHLSTGGAAISPPAGKLLYPIDAPVTSEFGYRTHPISGTTRLHAGMDFGADTGIPIKAAEKGEVIHAGWYDGYGNTVILDHGGGLTTLYAHASELLVSQGQTLRAGQPVSLVGSTGYSTGPHLHFEVMENGEPVNPRNYLD